MTAESYATVGDVTVEFGDETIGGYRRTAQINCHFAPRQRGKSYVVAMLALGMGCGSYHEAPVLKRVPTDRSAKHWVQRRDWEQRNPRQRR